MINKIILILLILSFIVLYYFNYIEYYSQIQNYRKIKDYTRWILSDKFIDKLYAKKNVFSIPIHPYLTDLEVEYIIENIKKANNLF